MSYIYAHKTENSIKILSDTKVTINSNDLSRLKKRFSEKEYNNFLKYGFIKTVIYKPNITISSAGEVEHFNELLSFLYQNNINDITVIQNKALEINVHYNRDTDFIITTEKEIFKVAEKKIQNVSSCWIGDEDANNEFAKFKEKVILPDIYYTEIVSESTKKI